MGLQSDRIVHGLKQQPCGVQVVEWVGLVVCQFAKEQVSVILFGCILLLIEKPFRHFLITVAFVKLLRCGV